MNSKIGYFGRQKLTYKESIRADKLKGTKNNPLDLSDLIKFLCKKENKPTKRKVYIDRIDVYKNIKGLRLSHLYIDGYKIIGAQDLKGGVPAIIIYKDEKKVFIKKDEIEGNIYYYKYPKLSDFKTPINKAGKYKYCEGGGWYSKRQLYEVEGKYYCNLTP